ncbi:exodeoxyribonuclease V subunit beta [Tannerella sp.]|uniref:UvrD-helicase domain-containing protein n=1 Tax=Tannerella sp. TaxID=2382127 RepID=UPI0026DB2A6D|nr:UvrD-helicase domain-containing protein [Tannerella sp.]MDO4703887.1 UvrD-helicase domain-containing protein [Tannerella sp.]
MLTIYRASAGTGKTHTLTGDYLHMLFATPDAYRHILAVTFTNKATEEMKNRILSELYLLASGRPSDYTGMLSEAYRLTEQKLRLRARTLLIRILHDYSAFNISTIDHFFQQTMRAFVREIGLQGNYRIEMDRDLVLSEAIDSLLADLDREEHKDLLEWLLRFSEDKVEKGETWDLRTEIRKLSNELFKESYKAFRTEVNRDIADRAALAEYKNMLYAIIRSTESQAVQIGEKGQRVMEQYGLQPSDFKGGSRSAFFLFDRLVKGSMKEPSTTFKALPDKVENWYAKTIPPERRQAIEQAYAKGLNECVHDVCRFFDGLTNYYTALAISRNLYTLGILNDIEQQIRQWREEKNCMLIADTTELLNRIIDGSDIPFIYEKTGTRIEHYMIDEFQDTSAMQWRNFRPLLKESLAYRRANLIVGDIKQSIYRFRNSDWTLLDEQIGRDFPASQLTEKTLSENWRSCRNIVEFNNALFTVVPQLLQTLYNHGIDESALSPESRERYAANIVSAYSRSYQHVALPFRAKQGHVRIELLPDEDEHSWKDKAMLRLPLVIEQLQKNGYALRDIAVLVRTRNEGIRVADTLLDYKETHPDTPFRYDIISEDALLIGQASSVRFMIGMLQYLNRPDDVTAARTAEAVHAVMQMKTSVEASVQTIRKEVETAFEPEIFAELQQFLHRSFYETVEGLYRLFKADFPENEQVFIQAFLDLTAEYGERETPDIDRFLKWWKETGCQSKIATPDTQNAIRILTIHKSKGLGFKAVILPFGDWEVDSKSGTMLWCHPSSSSFNRLQVVPVNYTKDLCRTLFAEAYYHEKLHAYIDGLNTLYVALTRAKEELIVFTPDEKAPRTQVISQLLREALHTECYATAEGDPLYPLAEGFREEENLFEWGDGWKPETIPTSDTEELSMKRIPSVKPDERMFLHLHRHGDFFDDTARRYGILMHDLLSRIRTTADISVAVAAKEVAGEIGREEAPDLIEKLQVLLNAPAVRPWFDGSMQILNETDILVGNGYTSRPDRIMLDEDRAIVVDYKFGTQKDRRYIYQMKTYVRLLREMGITDVQGCLWYIELGEMEAVSD